MTDELDDFLPGPPPPLQPFADLSRRGGAPHTTPRIRDVDLARRLGYRNPYAIRKLLHRLQREGVLTDVQRPTVLPLPAMAGLGPEPVGAFWLTEEQALLVCARSRTAAAKATTAQLLASLRPPAQWDARAYVTANAIGREYGVSPQRVGRLARELGLFGTDGNGRWRQFTPDDGSNPIRQWMYSHAAKEQMRPHLAKTEDKSVAPEAARSKTAAVPWAKTA